MFLLNKNNIIKYLFAFALAFCFLSSLVNAKSSFSGDKLRKSVLDYVYNKLGNDAEVYISNNIQDVYFEENGISAKINADTKALKGNCYVAVEFYYNQRMKRRLDVPVRIKIYKDVPVATAKLTRGATIQPSEIAIEKKEITNYNINDIVKPDKVTGKTLKQNLTAGAILTNSMFESDNIIKRGSKVPLIVQSGSVRITSLCEALQDGEVGKNILIRREGTQNSLLGKVMDDGSVLINVN